MVSRINSSGLTKAQKLFAVESIKSAILTSRDEENNRKVEKVFDQFVDVSSDSDRDVASNDVSESNDALLLSSDYNPTVSHDFFDLLFTPGDENIGNIRVNLQHYTLQTSVGGSSSTEQSETNKLDELLRERYYEMSNYYFVTTEGLHINQYI